MPDLGLGKAIGKAVREGAKNAKVVRPAEQELLKAEAEAAAKKAAAERAAAGVEPKTAPEVPPGALTPEPAPAAAVPQPVDPLAPPAQPPAPKPTPAIQPSPVLDEAAAAREASRLSRVNLGDYALDEVHMPNFDVMENADDVKAVIADLAEQNKAHILEAKGPAETNAELLRGASDLGVTPEELATFARTADGAVDRRKILAARQMQSASAEVIADISQKITAGTASDLDRIKMARQIQLHNAIRRQLAGAEADWGRAGHAFRIPVGGDAAQVQRVKEILAGGGADLDRIAAAVVLNPTIEGVNEIVKQGIFRRAAGASMNLVNRVFVNGILSGPTTHAVNTMGNAMFQAMNTAELQGAAWLGRFLPGEEHVAVGEALAHLHGTLGATRDAFRLAGRALKHGETIDNSLKYEVTGQGRETLHYLPELNQAYLGRMVHGMDQFIGIPTRLLGAEDDFFKTLSYRAYAEKEALLHVQDQIEKGALKLEDAAAETRRFMENAPEEVQAAAESWARDMTFQTPLGPTGSKAQLFLRAAPVLTLIAPFIRTPVNIFKQAAYRSPMALFSQKFWSAVQKGGRERDLALTRFAMGSGTAALISYMVANDDVTGGGPQDPDARTLKMQTGWRPYSFRVRNPVTNEVTYHSYARMEPIASVIGATADATEILSYLNSDVEGMTDEETQAYQAAGAIIAGIMNNTGNKTFMQGISDFVELTNDPGQKVRGYTNQMVSSLVPYSALERSIRNTEDPYLREAWSLLDKVKDNTPGLSKSLPMRMDLFGEPREKNSSTLLGTMSPLPESPEKYDYVVKEIARVMKATNVVPVTMPQKRIDGMKLTAKEYAAFVKLSRHDPVFGGKTFHDLMDDTINSEVYQNATPFMQADLLKRVQSQADTVGSAVLERENPDYADRITSWRLKRARLKTGE